MGALQPYFNVTPESPKDNVNAKDNAVGAVSRMLRKAPTALPLESVSRSRLAIQLSPPSHSHPIAIPPQVLPIFLSALPLTSDKVENKPAFEAIFHLFETQPASMMPHIDHLLQVFKYVLDPSRPDDLQEDTRERLVQLIQALGQQMPDKVAAAGLM